GADGNCGVLVSFLESGAVDNVSGIARGCAEHCDIESERAVYRGILGDAGIAEDGPVFAILLTGPVVERLEQPVWLGDVPEQQRMAVSGGRIQRVCGDGVGRHRANGRLAARVRSL